MTASGDSNVHQRRLPWIGSPATVAPRRYGDDVAGLGFVGEFSNDSAQCRDLGFELGRAGFKVPDAFAGVGQLLAERVGARSGRPAGQGRGLELGDQVGVMVVEPVAR